MSNLEQDALDQELSFTNSLPSFVRILMFITSFLPGYGFYDLVLKPRWTDYFNVIFFFFLIMGLAALGIGIALMLMSLGGAELVRFDSRDNSIYRIRAASILPRKEIRYFANQVKTVELVKIEDEGEITYRSELQFFQGKSLQLKRFHEETTAAAYHAKLKQWLANAA
jgi:hypothetical protein